MASKGKFIVFEGIDGSGKSSQMRLLAQYLGDRGVRVHLTCEPTQSPIGSLLRDCLTGKLDTDERTIAALFAADRLHHIYGREDGILARLDAGESVLCDRFYFSSLAYNGGMAESEWVKQLNTPAMNACVPDLVVFIDLTPEDAMARILRRGKTDRYESVGLLEKIRTGYLKAFENVPSEKLAFIKSEQEKSDTQQHIRNAVDRVYGF